MSLKDVMAQFTPDQTQMILGTLLGDGCITGSKNGPQRYQSNHGWCQNDYNCSKHQILSEYATNVPSKVKNGGYGDWSSLWRTTTGAVWTSLRALLYPGGIKTVTAEWLDMVDERGLAWFVGDDGSLQGGRYMRLNVQGFLSDDVELIVDWLEHRWDAPCSIVVERHNREHGLVEYPLILVTVQGTYRLINAMQAFIPAPMAYKVAWHQRLCQECGTELVGHNAGIVVCRECLDGRQSQLRADYYVANKATILRMNTEWKQRNPDRARLLNKRSYWADIDRSRARSRVNAAKFRALHPERVKEIRKNYLEQHKDDPAHKAMVQRHQKTHYAKKRNDPKRWAATLEHQREIRKQPEAREKETAQLRKWRVNNPDKVKKQQERAEKRRRQKLIDNPELKEQRNKAQRNRYRNMSPTEKKTHMDATYATHKKRLATDPEFAKSQRIQRKERHTEAVKERGPTGSCMICGCDLFYRGSKVCKSLECRKEKQRRYVAAKRSSAQSV